jgi:RNA polymerase sigma factor (sigma-70 family)
MVADLSNSASDLEPTIDDLRVLRADPDIPDEEVQALWRRLFLYYVPRLRHALASRALDEDELKDLVQTTWMNVFDARKQFRGTGPFSHWVLTIALRVSAKHVGKEIKRRERLMAAADQARDAAPTPEAQMMERTLDLGAALESLTERERKHFRLYSEGFSADEIREALGYSSMDATWKQFSRIRDKLTSFVR